MELSQKQDLISFLIELTPIEKVEIVDKLLSSFSSNLEKENEILLQDEVEQRLLDYSEHKIKAKSMEEVFNFINKLK